MNLFNLTMNRITRDIYMITIYTENIAHAFPTGDLFRSLRIRILTPKNYLIKEWVLKKEFVSNDTEMNLSPKKLIIDNVFPPPQPPFKYAKKEFIFHSNEPGDYFNFEMYLDYQNSSTHFRGDLPDSETRLLFKVGQLKKERKPTGEG